MSTAPSIESGPTLVPPAAPEARPPWVWPALVTVALLPRLLAFPFNENFHGDAMVRTELAERWLQAPHWIGSFKDGAYQFGPLHLYLVALVLKLGVSREDAGRVLSLLVGTATALPLYALTRRLWGGRNAWGAVFAFAVWGMHIQFSTTAASEALALFLTLACLAVFARALDEGRFPPLALAALLLNLACATRYDAWMLIPVLCGVLLLQDPDRVAALTRAVLFGLLCLPFPLIWMQGNEVATGDPLYPMTYINAYHAASVGDGLARYGQVGYRLHNLFFWPGAALLTLTPLIALLGLAGMVAVWRARAPQRWLIWVALLPTAYFAFRGAVQMNFAPLGRFTSVQVALLLPFLGAGFEGVSGAWTRAARRALAYTAGAIAILFPAWLGAFTYHSDVSLATTLSPVSPVSTHPVQLMRVAHYLRDTVRPQAGGVIVDSDPHYRDLAVAFFGELPEARMARYRWEDFSRVLPKVQARVLVRIEGGGLERDVGFQFEAHAARFQNQVFKELPGFEAPYHVYLAE